MKLLRFCEPGDSYSVAWVDGGLSRCFLEVVGSISCAGIIFIVGLAGIILGPKVRGRWNTICCSPTTAAGGGG